MEHLKLLPLYEVNIDFDKASNATSNKKIETKTYICGATLKWEKMSTKTKKTVLCYQQIYKQSL